MKIRTSLAIQLLMLILNCAISAVYYFRLPDPTPVHWNIHGQIDRYGSKWEMLLLGPGMLLLSIAMTVFLPKLSPKNYEIDSFSSTFAYAMLLVAALFTFIGILTLRSSADAKIWSGGTFMTAMFVFFALLGNILGRVRQNFYMGIRTPWTLASEPVWNATHRSAAHLWFVGGLVGAILALAGLPLAYSLTLLLILAFVPVVQSYFLYQKLER